MAGVLSFDAITFLLAVQNRTRGASTAAERHIASLLAENQAAAFTEHLRDLEGQALDILPV